MEEDAVDQNSQRAAIETVSQNACSPRKMQSFPIYIYTVIFPFVAYIHVFLSLNVAFRMNFSRQLLASFLCPPFFSVEQEKIYASKVDSAQKKKILFFFLLETFLKVNYTSFILYIFIDFNETFYSIFREKKKKYCLGIIFNNKEI